MITCPNKSSQEWKNLVKEFGEIKAMYLFTLNNEVIPTVTEANEILNASKENIKPGVSELFESNPELANAVYEALGFKTTNDNFEIIGEDFNRETGEGIVLSLKYKGELKHNIPLKDRKNIVQREFEYLKKLRDESIYNIKSLKGTINSEGNLDVGNGRTVYIKSLGLSSLKEYQEYALKQDFESRTDSELLKRAEKEIPLYESAESITEVYLSDDGSISGSLGSVGIEIPTQIIGKGFGKDAYRTIAKYLQSKNKTLKSDALGHSEAAHRVWESLRKSGEAKIIKGSNTDFDGKFYTAQYEYIGTTTQLTPQQKQQAQQLYSEYLDTIFPDSKVKDIVYHGTDALRGKSGIDKEGFKKPNRDKLLGGKNQIGIFFTDKENASNFSKDLQVDLAEQAANRFEDTLPDEYKEQLRNTSKPILIPAIINASNPINLTRHELQKQWENLPNKVNSVLVTDLSGKYGYEKVVFEPEQIHILGSKQDIEGFREFASNENNTQNVQYQLPQGREIEEFVASEKTIRDLAARMSDRIGIPVRFESDRSKEYKGKIENNVAYINLAYATLDTPIHEILGHPIIRAIKNGTELYNFKYKIKELNDPSAPGKFQVETFSDENLGDIDFFDTEQEAKEYVKSLKLSQPKIQLYQNLLKELEYGKGKEVFDRIKRDYNFKDTFSEYAVFDYQSEQEAKKVGAIFESVSDDGEAIWIKWDQYSLEEQQEEAIVELLGLYTAGKLDKVKDGKLISLLKRLLKEMKAFMRNLLSQREVEIDKLPDIMTLGDIADLLAYSNSKLILPGYEVVYTTPDNQQFKTYQEASKHISELAKSVEDVDLSNLSIRFATKIEDVPDKFSGYAVTDNISGDGYEVDIFKNSEGKFKQIHPYTWEELDITDEQVLLYYNGLVGIKSFIEKNKEYEQSKEIIEEWKKVNNIQYNPEEVYSRGQEFVSVVGAYSDFDVNLMMQNLLQHIEDNKKAGGEFTISAFTKPIDRLIPHLESGGGKIKFKIYPQSQDIKWAANTDVYSGSVWDASEKVSKDKKSELLGVSYTKYPSLQNVNRVQPNLANIIDNLAYHHNELGIELIGSNFRLEYDKDIPYTTKKLINSINSILDQKYGKLVKPEINKGSITYNIYSFSEGLVKKFNTEQEAKDYIEYVENLDETHEEFDDGLTIKRKVNKAGIQPAQTNETLKEGIVSIKNKVTKGQQFDPADLDDIREDFEDGKITQEQYDILTGKLNKKEYTEQALINTKIAKLKEVAKKYPRSLIRSKVRPISTSSNLGFVGNELPFQKVSERFIPTKKESETKERFIERMNSRIENGMYKERSGELVPITNTYNPETWWVEKIEKLVDFKTGVRKENLFTFDKVNKKLQELVSKYSEEGYSFRRVNTYIPPVTTVRANPAPNNRAIWKIEVTKSLLGGKIQEAIINELDSDEANSDIEEKISDFFDNVENKDNVTIISELNKLEVSDEIKKLNDFLLSKLSLNSSLKIVISEEVNEKGFADYNVVNNTITIYRNNFIGKRANFETLAITFAHELLHSFTYRALINNSTSEEKEFYTVVKRLYNIAKKNTKFKNHIAYASKDSHGNVMNEATKLAEFLSYIFTLKDLQNELRPMKLNTWGRLIVAIKKFFGIKNITYDYVLNETISFINNGFEDIEVDTKKIKKLFKLQRSLEDDLYLQQEQPTHLKIWERLNNFANDFTVDRANNTYIHTKTNQKFVSNTEKMNSMKVTNAQLSDDPAIRAKQLAWRKKQIDIAEVINVTASSNLSKVAAKVAESNGLGQDESIVKYISQLLNKFKKPNVTILTNVLVADVNLLLADTIDMVVIDEQNKVHIFKFETRQYGFKDWETVTNYGGTIPYSDRQRVSYRLSAQVDYFERVTGKGPVTANVIMLHTPVVNNVITSVKLDVTNPKFPTGIDSLPYNSSVNSMYKDAEIKIGRTNDDIFSEDKIDVDTYDAIAEEEKERLKTHASTSKQLTKREEIVNQSIEALIYKKQLIARRGKSYEIEKMDQMIEDLLAEKDTEKALIKILEFANREAERIWNEYQRYTKNDKEIPLNILYGWRDSVSAFDAIMNDEDGLESLLSREHGFKGGPEYRQTLRNTMNMISSIKGLYESLGMDRLVDFLAPNYNKLYAELKRNKQKEYRRKKFKGEIPTGLTEAEYVDKALDERAEDLDIRTRNLIRAELKKASRDIGVLTRWIDNLLDSTDPVTAAMVKGFAFADENSRIEALEKRDEFVLMVRKLEADFKKRNGRPPKSNEELYDFMLEKDDEGNLTGHYITHYKSEMITEYRQIIAVAKEFETAEQRKAYIKGWLNENNPLSTASFREAYLKFLEDEVNKENAILSEKAHRHILDNTYLKNKLSINQMMENNMLTEEEGSLISNWLSENTWVHRVPIRKWLNPQWSQLEKITKDKNDVRGEFYNFIINTRNQADKFIPFAFRLDTRLPGIIKQNHERVKSGQSITQMTINSFKDDFTFRVDDTHRHQELTDESGNAKYFLPVHFTGRVTKDVKVITPEGVTETKTIFDPEEQSFDIAGIYYKYWTMANDYNHKSEILPKMELAKFMIEKRHAIKRDFKGNIIERASSTVSGKIRKGSNVIINKTQLADQVHDWFLMCVYGQTESDAGKLGNLDLGKFIQFLNKYTAINLLGVNFIAGTANLILGETLQKIDVIAKEYVDHKSWFKADKWYLSHLRGTLGDIGARSPKNISTKLYEWMGIMDDYGKADMDRKTRFAQLMHSDTLFFTSHTGEHYMQNRFGLAMLDNMRAYDDNGQDIGSILDMVQLDDKGKLTFDSRMNREKSKWTDKDILIFKQKTRGILTRIHGEYSQLGKVAIERMAVGRMAYMFRKFIVPGFRRRWGREQYYERIGQFAEGNYITTGKFLGDVGGLIFGKTEENSEYSFLQRLISNLQSFKMSMLSEEWASLSDHEKANIVRTISEVGFLITAIIIANIAMRFRGDADDPDEERFWSFLSYQAYRLQNELLFFTPKLDSAMSILRSPAASISVVENIIKLTGQIFHPLEVYETGTWKGRPKILKTLMNMTPVERQFYRLRDVSDQVTWVQNAAFGDGGSGKMSAPTQ